MGTGRARGRQINIWLDDDRYARLAQIAEAEGITRTALIERWIDQHYSERRPDQQPG